MHFPCWSEWLYSVKSLVAALLALWLALMIPLENPYWAMASVYVVANPLSGATRSKAMFRALGTMLGAAACVLMMPVFAHQPPMLCLVMACWLGGMFYLSLLDRSPRAYIFMLAAYTVPLVMLTVVNSPEAIFDTALSRAEEILLGIVCASVVHGVAFPNSVATVVIQRMDALLRDARHWSHMILSGKVGASEEARALQSLLADVMLLDALAVQLEYDSANRRSARDVREFQARMAMLVPQLDSLVEPLQQMKQALGGTVPELTELLAELERWIAGDGQPDDGQRLHSRSLHLETWLSDRYPQQALLIAFGLRQVRQLIALWSDCLTLRQRFGPQPGGAAAQPLSYQVAQRVGRPQHYDYLLNGVAAVSVAASVLCLSLLWIASDWNSGFTGVFMAAVAGCFFGAQDNPEPLMRHFLRWTLVSCLGAGFYLFFVLPNVHSFGSLALVLALPLLLVGSMGARPQFGATVMLLCVQGLSNMMLTEHFHADFELFADTCISAVGGVLFALVWSKITRGASADWAARRLARSGWKDLAQIAQPGAGRVPGQVAARMIDRMAQLWPRLGLSSRQDFNAAHSSRDLRVCFRLLELQQSAASHAFRQRLRPVLAAVRDYYASCGRAHRVLPVPAALERLIERALPAAPLPGPGREGELYGSLLGLKLALFPTPRTVSEGLSS